MTPLLALQTTRSGEAAAWRLLDLPEPWVVVLVVLPLLVLVSAAAYFREDLAPRAKLALGTLRFLALALLCLVLARPVELVRSERVHPAQVLVLVDDSASMRRQDSYAGDADARRGLERLTGVDPAGASRSELVRRGLESELLPRLEAGGYEPLLYRFDRGVVPLDEQLELEGRGQATHLGDALVAALRTHRGRHLTDVVVLSDGRSNGGLPVLDAARSAAAAGLPVHTVVVGDARPERNAVLELVDSPEAALEGDELAFTVRLVGRGSADGLDAEVLLEELGRDADDARVVDRRSVELVGVGDRLVLIAPPGPAESRTGERRFRLRVPPIEGETLVDDNAATVSVRVSPEKVRVLYVEGYPRWEYRKLALDFLVRAEDDVEFQAWLASAMPGFPQEHGPGALPLAALPTTRRELLDDYDVVILGDVNPYALFDDPADGDRFLTAVREFVEGGGGLLVQAGEFENPRSLLGTPLEDVLPVSIDPSVEFGFDGDSSTAFRPILEDPVAPHEIVRLDPDPETNRRLWEDAGGLRGFYWYSPVTRAKPGAEVLLRHPTDENRHGRRALLVAGYFPAGRTLFLAVDSTWRWQYRFKSLYFERFWRSALRWLALGRLRSGDRRYRLETPRSTYDIAERVVLEARVLDEDYRPSDAEAQAVRWTGPEGRVEEVALELVPERPGLYRGALKIDRPGLYSAWIEAGGERVGTTEFEVVLPSRENAEPAPDPQTLAALARLTRGRAVELSALQDLAAELPGGEERREPISSQVRDLWDRWWTLILALVVLSAEWIARKRLELV